VLVLVLFYDYYDWLYLPLTTLSVHRRPSSWIHDIFFTGATTGTTSWYCTFVKSIELGTSVALDAAVSARGLFKCF